MYYNSLLPYLVLCLYKNRTMFFYKFSELVFWNNFERNCKT